MTLYDGLLPASADSSGRGRSRGKIRLKGCRMHFISSLISLVVSVDAKHHVYTLCIARPVGLSISTACRIAADRFVPTLHYTLVPGSLSPGNSTGHLHGVTSERPRCSQFLGLCVPEIARVTCTGSPQNDHVAVSSWVFASWKQHGSPARTNSKHWFTTSFLQPLPYSYAIGPSKPSANEQFFVVVVVVLFCLLVLKQ